LLGSKWASQRPLRRAVLVQRVPTDPLPHL
jgi:hypothetical protein